MDSVRAFSRRLTGGSATLSLGLRLLVFSEQVDIYNDNHQLGSIQCQ